MINKHSYQRAIKVGDVETVGAMVEEAAGQDIRFAHGWTPLHAATKSGHLEIVSLLLKHRANINAETDLWQTPLDIALARQHAPVVELLQDHGGIKSVEVSLHAAAFAGNLPWVQRHWAAGADINALRNGRLPLCLALERRHWGGGQVPLEQKSGCAEDRGRRRHHRRSGQCSAIRSQADASCPTNDAHKHPTGFVWQECQLKEILSLLHSQR